MVCLWANGYRPKNVPEMIAFITSEFWGNMKCFPMESIDEYYNQFHDILDNLVHADEPVSTKSAKDILSLLSGQNLKLQ